VISELSNGELHTDSRYVKVSGGLLGAAESRPVAQPRQDPLLKMPDGVKINAPTPVDLQVVHPNDTGFELNNVTVMLSAHFVRSIRSPTRSQDSSDAELDFSIAENPTFRFQTSFRKAPVN